MRALSPEQEAFCRREHPRLVGALAVYCGDRELARDLAQEALARACQHWGRVAAMEAPGAWVHRVAINLAKRHARRTRSAARADARYVDGQRPIRSMDTAETLAVRAAVAALPERQRAALALRYYADLPVAEAARAMGCAEGTVKALTHQAIGALREAGLTDEADVAPPHEPAQDSGRAGHGGG